MKMCSKCKELKLLKEFNKRKNSTDGKSYYCKECSNNKSKTHYLNNKQDYIDRSKNNRNVLKEKVNKIKSTRGCENDSCDEKRFWVLDFHHKDDNKEGTISQMMYTVGINTLLKEIEKCICLCANCHRDLHYRERNNMASFV